MATSTREALANTDAAAKPVEIYDAEQGWRNLLPDWRELVRRRFLLRNLIVRDLKVRYKNSLLGVLWSLLNPLLMMVVFSLVFGVLSANGPRQYPVFFLVGLLPWNFFSGALISSTASITSNQHLVKKVYFPREILPTAAVLSNLVNFFIALIVLVVFLYAAGLGISVHAWWLIPLVIIQVIFTMGLGLLLSSLHVFYRDIMMILDVVMLAWFFLTPIMYPLSRFDESVALGGIDMVPSRLMRWVNPMASLVDGYRTVLWGTMSSNGPVAMDPAYLLRTFVTALLVLIVGYGVFNRTQHLFGETL